MGGCRQGTERGDGARRRRQWDGVRAHIRGQGRRLDARRGCPLEVNFNTTLYFNSTLLFISNFNMLVYLVRGN
jgi:hypothetical protein